MVKPVIRRKSIVCLAKILSASKIPQFSLAAAGERSLQST
jgi:hypothetical protein